MKGFERFLHVSQVWSYGFTTSPMGVPDLEPQQAHMDDPHYSSSSSSAGTHHCCLTVPPIRSVKLWRQLYFVLGLLGQLPAAFAAQAVALCCTDSLASQEWSQCSTSSQPFV